MNSFYYNVDYRWNEVIRTSPRTMKKFNLRVAVVKNMDKFEDILKSTKRYHSMSVYQTNQDYAFATKKLLTQHGSHLRYFKLSDANIQCPKDLFQCTPLLESLDLIDVSLAPTTDDPQGSITLPHLKHLKFHRRVKSCENFLDLITGVKSLKSLDLDVEKIEDRRMVVTFLNKHPDIESFTIGSRMIENLFINDDITNIPFRLKKLILGGHLIGRREVGSSFADFLKLHEETLKFLRIEFGINNDFYQIVFTQFRNLTELEIFVTCLPSEKSFYFCMSAMKNVKKLKVLGRFQKHEIAKLFISNLPAIQDLDCRDLRTVKWFPKFLRTIATHQPDLQHLKIPNFYKGTPQNLHFQQLKSIYVSSIDQPQYWKNFVLNHDTLESIIVKKYEQSKLSVDDIESILNLPHLTHIRFNAKTRSAIKQVFDVVKKNYKNLRIAEFGINISGDKPETYRIYLPRDRKDWQPEQHERFFALY